MFRVRRTIGGDQIDYPGVTAAYTANLETIRILLNATVSEDASFMTADIKDFYLDTPMDRKKYMRFSLKQGHIWLTTGWDPGTTQTGGTLGNAWIQTVRVHSMFIHS